MVDAWDLKSLGRKAVQVRVLPRAICVSRNQAKRTQFQSPPPHHLLVPRANGREALRRFAFSRHPGGTPLQNEADSRESIRRTTRRSPSPGRPRASICERVSGTPTLPAGRSACDRLVWHGIARSRGSVLLASRMAIHPARAGLLRHSFPRNDMQEGLGSEG